MLSPTLTLGQARAVPAARAVIDTYLPVHTDPAALPHVSHILVSSFIRVVPELRDDEARRSHFWSELEAALEAPVEHGARIAPNPDLEGPDVTAGSAPWTQIGVAGRWGVLEICLEGPREGNPFVDVELSAEFRCGQRSWEVGGFYDGNGTYRLRVLAEEEGAWEFTTRSSARSLDGVRGEVVVGPAQDGQHGPVRADGFHFVHADGTRYRPWGTTAYVWNYQPDEVQEATLAQLRDSAFTKLRMCLFPKSFIYNEKEPSRVPFVRDADGVADVTRFDVEFFRQLDEQVRALGALDVQADLILFHPYDRWGFSDLGRDVDERVVRYVVRRLAAFSHVWWSLANEWDLLTGKSIADWDHIGETVSAEDPHGHLLSIHNFVEFFDHGRPWITHASIQRGDVENVGEWRSTWNKPVVLDECSYEGDLEYDWGNATAQEMVRRFWVAAVRGGYGGHGETYWNAEQEIWWSTGGRLVGTSHQRFAFLEDVVAASPTGVLEPQPSGFDTPWAGVPDRYLVAYLGGGQPREHHVLLPPGRWTVDVLDTWACTVDPVPGVHETFVHVPLPGRPYMALRIVAVAGSDESSTDTAKT